MTKTIRKIVLAGAIATVALGVSGIASAQVRVGVNVGVPIAPVYVAPQPVYAPPPPAVVYAPPPPVYSPAIVIGWHGDRYYDGHRYWNRGDYYRYHGGPHHYDHRGWN